VTGRRVRGFVILVVLLMLAVITAVAIGQLSVVVNESTVSVRREEEAQARAIAEGCLLMLQKKAERFMGAPAGGVVPTPPTPPGGDFDGLLNPAGGAVRDGDEHIPSITGATAVKIPKGASGTSERQWLLIPRTAGTQAGACFVRYEDNSDDNLPTGFGVVDTDAANCGGEGTGVDVTFCDRDGAIYLTAIGVYPKLPGTADADVYASAHARVTLRKLFQVAVPGSFPAAVTGKANVKLSTSIKICGVGGVFANDIDTATQGNSCMCGSAMTNVAPAPAPTLSSTCCTSCSPGTLRSGVAAPRPIDIDGDALPVGPYAAAADPELMPPSPLQPDLPVGGTFRANQGFGDPRTSANNIGAIATCKLYLRNDGMVYYWDRTDTDSALWPGAATPVIGVTAPPVTADCGLFSPATVPLPCAMDPAVPTTINCTASAAGGLCWKPLAKLGDGVSTSTLFPGGEFTDAVGNALMMKTTDPPFVKVAGKHLADAVAGNRLCGTLGTPAATGYLTQAAGDYTLSASTATDHVAATYFFVDQAFVAAGARTAAQPYVNIGVLAGGSVTINNNWNLSCPTCANPTGLTLTVGAAGTCKIPVAGATPYADAGQLPLNRVLPGYVVKTDGTLNWGAYTLAGLTWTDQNFASAAGSPCFVGRMVVLGNFVGDSDANINVAGEWLVKGTVGGIANAVTVTADVYAEGAATIANNWRLNGRLYGNGAIDVKNTAVVTYDGGGSGSSYSNALSSFMESQW
jgi:hypothetical protein